MNEPTNLTENIKPAARNEIKLLYDFFGLFKTARIVSENNATYVGKLVNFFKLFQVLKEEQDGITFKIISDHFFLNDKLVHFDDKGLSGAGGVVSEWKILGIGGVRFAGEITLDELGKFFRFMAEIKPVGENLDTVHEDLKTHGLANIEILSSRDMEVPTPEVSEETRQRFRKMARVTFFRAMSVVEETLVDTVRDKDINIAKTKRVVHGLIDHVTRDASSLLELTAIKDFDDYTYAHSTNVCVYALTVGVRLSLDRPRLSQLGMTALFHDLGKIKLPADLIRKPEAFDEDDWVQMQLHPMLGAKTILRNLKFDAHAARAARGAMEHHINRDFTGYPQLRLEKRPPNLFSKIITIVDAFDALTSGRVYIKKRIEPDEVFKKMRFQMQVKFDPFLLKLFNDIIGIYPSGSLVLLSSNEIAMILTNNETDKARPLVKIIGNRDGLFARPSWADLASEEHRHRRVIRIIDPERYNIDIKDFILKD
ncbi:MAG: HD domain-containing protein [candidate division Zixibacteria bacterium]|nr:HD domain-containing protein [candidate division Zixibacteria bacterium]